MFIVRTYRNSAETKREKKMNTVTFDYNDFNTTTSRSNTTRKHGSAYVVKTVDGIAIKGDMGYSKIRNSVHEAMREYLGGRELISFRVFD